MSKEIWLGPVLGTNRERLLARCAEFVSKGQAERLLYIAASHPLLDLVTEKLLDGEQTRGVWGEFPVYLFRGFVRRVHSSAIVSEARPSGSPDASGLLTRALLTRVAIDREDLPLRDSLISQIIKQLAAAGRLKAINPLANSDGCVNTIASLIGEIQRAGTTPDEFRRVVEARETETATEAQRQRGRANEKGKPSFSLRSQADFDRDVARMYSAYAEALDRFDLTDEDADQLRALQMLWGELDGLAVSLPWLDQIELLVLDGFFDFTPVQGEMLRRLIPTIPNVIVNLNYDPRNSEIFQPFQPTIEQLKAMAAFEEKINCEFAPVSSGLTSLRQRLFHSGAGKDAGEAQARMPAIRPQDAGAPISFIECSDRETEIRAIAKEIKRLILEQGYKLSEIALVARERSAYADTILRVCAEESIPCNLERHIEAPQVPAVRACGKLFQLLKEPAREGLRNPKAGELAHLIKTDYFRVSPEDLPALIEEFDNKYSTLLSRDDTETESKSKLSAALGIGRWSPDILENVIAYVGSEQRIDKWIDRAQRLIRVLPSTAAARELISGSESGDEDSAPEPEQPTDETPVIEPRKKPVPVHPAAIAWTAIVLRHMQQVIADLQADGDAEALRIALASLLNRFNFPNQVRRPFQKTPPDIPQATLDVRGLEAVRRAMTAAVRSFNYAAEAVSLSRTAAPSLTVGLLARLTLSDFISEVERCLHSQVFSISPANRDGLRVLEATDVRGLRFRVIFIAGMIEGGFPLRASRDWLYPHEERERLKKYGVVLEDISTDTLLKEEHYFYQAACRATDRLYLTRPLSTGNDNETVASYYVEELHRAIAPAQIEVQQIRGDMDTRDLTEASTASELAISLVRQQERHKHRARGDLLPKTQLEKMHLQARAQDIFSESALRRVDIERTRNGAWFGPFDGEITNADLRAMLSRRFGHDYVHSASGLSVYGNCAFKFFAGRVLRLEPRSEAALDLQALDAGKLLHDVLRRFFERHRKQYLPSLDAYKLRRELAEIADRVFDEHEDLVPPLNPRIWQLDREIRKLILDQVLHFELRLQNKTDRRGVRPTYFELAFGRASAASDPASSTNFLELDRPGEAVETALVQGQIDRVDVNEAERLAVAYDYKLSQGAKLEDIAAGRQVQIPIYLAALEQLFLPGFNLAGGGYYRLRGTGGRLNQGLYRRMLDDCTSVTSTKTRLDDIEWARLRLEVTRRVWEFIDGMRGAHFRVKPSLGKMTCKFCDYSAVCRYDTYRISRKRTQWWG